MSRLLDLGFIGLLFIIIVIILLPFVISIVVGVSLANLLGFTGLSWWCFVILFYLVITAIFSSLSN